MENNQLGTTPTSAPVMDVQPQQIKVTDQVVVPTTAVTEVVAPEQPQTVTQPQGTETPVSTPPAAPESSDAPVPATKQPEAAQPLVAKSNGHHKTPIGVILVAIFVALGLGAVSVIAYTKSNDGQNKPAAELQATTNKTPDVTSDDVDATSTAVDESLKQVDETTEFDTNSLSDTSLQL